MSDFREALADHLTGIRNRYGRDAYPVTPTDIEGIDVRWTEGEQGTSDYGDEYTTLPDLTVTVTLGPNYETVRADPAWCIENLMRLALGLELNP